MTRPTRTLYAVTPDGGELTYRTAAGYTFAGVIRDRDGNWTLAAKGWSATSVRNRTRAAAATWSRSHPDPADRYAVVPFHVRPPGGRPVDGHALYAIRDDGTVVRIGPDGRTFGSAVAGFHVLEVARRHGGLPGIVYLAVRADADPDPRWRGAEPATAA